MATLGGTSKPTASQEWSGPNSNEQVAEAHTFPAGGPWRVTRIGVWVAGKGSAANFKGVVWSADRNTVLGQTATFSATGRAFAVGNSDNYERDVVSEFVVAGGTTVYIGWWRNENDIGQWGRTSGGSHYDDTEASGPAGMAGESLDSGGGIGAYLEYEADNTAPNAPTNVKLESSVSGSVLNGADSSWLLTFTGSDPNGGSMASYDYQIDTTTGNGVAPDWASLTADVNDRTNGISGQNVSSTITHALTRGQWYALRVRTKDPGGLEGAWSSVYYFKVNSLPTIGTRTPAASGFAHIHNLATDLTVWTSAGSHAKPRLTFVYSDAEAQQSQKYRIRIYDAASGGNMVHDSGDVALVVASGTTITHDTNFAIVAGTERWWTVQVWDAMGEASAESSRTAFKMRFAQGIYEFNAGAGSSGWQWANAAVANGYSGFFFRTATGASGAGAGAFVTSIGALTPAAYLNVMVRLAPTTPGANVTLPSMTFTYIGGATTPDRWAVVGGASIVLDYSVRRYGSQALKVTTAAANSHVYPFTFPAGAQQDVPVVANVTYTFSAYVKTNTALSTGVRLAVYQAGTTTLLEDADTGAPVAGAPITDSSAFPDGWQRLTLTFTVPAGVSTIRPNIQYLGATAGQVFWLDAVQLEEGTVASHWRPGLVGEALTLDLNGIQVDGFAGGIIRLRGTAGGSRDIIELGANGLLLGGDAQITSPSVGDIGMARLRLTDTTDLTLASTQHALQIGPTSGANLAFDPNEIQARDNGSAADLFLQVDGGRTIMGGLRVRGAGSAFPSSPFTDELWHRIDRDILYFWDSGTDQWLSLAAYTLEFPAELSNLGATDTDIARVPTPGFRGGSGLWIESLDVGYHVAGGTALSASHKWAVQVNNAQTGGNQSIVTKTIDSGASSVWRRDPTAAVGVLVTASVFFHLIATKTGTPGTLYFYPSLTYRLVG